MIPEFSYTKTSVNFNSWSANSSAATSANGANNSKNVTAVISSDAHAFSCGADNVWGETTYIISGLTDGQTILFKEKNSASGYSDAATVLEVTTDGTYKISWGNYNTNSTKYVGFSKEQPTCDINIYNSTRPTTVASKGTQTLSMPRWRGFDNPFGDIWTNLDGIILERTAANEASSVYTTTDPTAFGDDNTAKGKMTVAGTEVAADGWTKDFDLGETGEIIPSVVGGSTTTYMCDYHYCAASSIALRTLFVGGSAGDGGYAGLGYFLSTNGVGSAHTYVGFRTLNKVV